MKGNRKPYSVMIGASALTLLFVFTVFSSTTASAALNGILLCSQKLIPSIFPILVLNGIIVKSGIVQRLSNFFAPPLSSVYGIRKSSVIPILLGILCGCPSGAVSVGLLLKDGKIDCEDASVALLLSSSMSAGFIISTVGGGMLFDTRRGVALWLIQLLSNFIVSVFIRKKGSNTPFITVENLCQKASFDLSSVIKDALDSMLVICGSVIFFSTLGGIIFAIHFLPPILKALIISCLEITSGASYITSEFGQDAAFILLCAAISWTGASMHCQTAGILKGSININKYVICKLVCAVISTVIGIALINIGIF